MPYLPILAGHLSVPCLTFPLWQYKLTDAVPSWCNIFHFISTQKPTGTSASPLFLWTLFILQNKTSFSNSHSLHYPQLTASASVSFKDQPVCWAALAHKPWMHQYMSSLLSPLYRDNRVQTTVQVLSSGATPVLTISNVQGPAIPRRNQGQPHAHACSVGTASPEFITSSTKS